MREPPIFHIILPALSESLLFPGSAPHSARRWYRRPEGSVFHQFLYPVFPVLRYVFRSFSVRFPASASKPALPFAAARSACFPKPFPQTPASGFPSGQEHIFQSALLFSPDNNHNRRYNFTTAQFVSSRILVAVWLIKYRSWETYSTVPV